MRILSGFACALFLAAGIVPADDSATHVSAAIEKGSDGAQLIAVSGLGERILKVCAAREAKSPEWEKAARIQIGGGTDAEIAERPSILGSWRVASQQLVFEPRFPFLAGTSVRVTIDPPLLFDAKDGKSSPLVFDLQLPQKDLTPVTKIENIFPTKNVLPENQLRFYIQFSKPMSRGDAYDHIQLLDGKGNAINDVFLELGEELWNPSMTRFTLLFHPGRVKQGLKPREELGPILEAGKSYTLVISGQWKDAEGRQLNQKELRKVFTAGPADNETPNPAKWKVSAPLGGTSRAFQVRFNEPLDYGLLNSVVWIVDARGNKVAGKISLSEEETLWSFTPERAWEPGKYRLVAETILEDLAANNIAKPFEVDVFNPIPKTNEAKTVELPFEIVAAK